MKNTIKIEARRFSVIVKNISNGEVSHDEIVLSKEQLQASQLVYQSSKELIHRLYKRNGFLVLDIYGEAEKQTIDIDLNGLWR